MITNNFEKRLIEFTDWDSKVNLSVPVENIASMKVMWMNYETASTGGKLLKMRLKSIGSNGLHMLADGSTEEYFYATALDSRANVAIYNDYFNDIRDIYFDKPIPRLWSFEIEIRINNEPAYDITSLNPLVVEFGFYH